MRGIPSGFGFLGAAGRLRIGESLIAYDPTDTYWRRFWSAC